VATASKTYSFTASTTAVASQVNTNFDDLVDFLNQEVIHKDASVAFTGVPSGPATDPSTANQLTRKAYVDGLLGTWTAYTPTIKNQSQAAVAATVRMAQYITIGSLVFFHIAIQATATSAAAGIIQVSLPSTTHAEHVNEMVGSGYFYDASVGSGGVGAIFAQTNTSIMLIPDAAVGNNAISVQLTSGDIFWAHGFYSEP
jgi:hypothetical protein